MGDFVGITKEKVKFAKVYKETFSTEIFRIIKVIQREPQLVYELLDSEARPIEGQIYKYKLVKVTLASQPSSK